MKKLMLAFAATVAFVSVASAEDKAWFTGTVGSEAGGAWTVPAEGVTTNGTTLVLDDPETALSFAATTQKGVSSSENLKFATNAKFSYSYDEFPEIDSAAKAGVVVVNDKFYVLAKDGDADPATNKWVGTTYSATVADAYDVSVVVSNGTSAVYAIYTIGGNAALVKEVVASGNWGAVDYKGSGEVASLVGTTQSLGFPIPGGGDPIPTDRANEWATAQGIPEEKVAEVLASQTEYNGRTAAESCLLGVKTNDVITAAVADNNAANVTFTANCNPVSGRATFALKTDGNEGAAQSSPTFEIPVADGIYSIIAYVDGANKQIPVSQEIGVKGTTVAASTVAYIGAPWDDCPITNLLKKTCCAAGDTLEVFDASNITNYYTWVLTDGEWKYAPHGEESEPALTLKKGQAVRYIAASAGNRYAVGNVSTVTTTPIVKGTDNWNLIANPNGEFAASQLPLDSTKAMAIQFGSDGVTPAKIFFKTAKGNVYWKQGWDDDDPATVGATQISGAFFLKTEKAESVNWGSPE